MTELNHIDKIKAGNQASFRWLVDTYQHMVFVTAIGFVYVKEDAEDLTQDVFVKVFDSIQQFSGDSQFSTWLYRITVNTCINFINKKKRSDLLLRTTDFFLDLVNLSTDSKNPEQELVETEMSETIRKAIDSLSNKQKTAFVLSKYDELSQKEIAEIMNISEGAVEQHLQRAKKNLQKKLGTLVGN